MIFLAETIPSSLDFTSGVILPKIGENVLTMIKNAHQTIDIASIYLTLLNDPSNETPSDRLGKIIHGELINATRRGVKIRLLLTVPSGSFQQPEADELARLYPKSISVGYLDLSAITGGNGIQHMKCVITDHSSFFIGSANCDWRAYTEVAEIGLFGINTDNAAESMLTMFNNFWEQTKGHKPTKKRGSDEYSAIPTQDSPITTGHPSVSLSFSISPPFFQKTGIQSDLDALQRIINDQNLGIIRLCAMEYSNYTYESGHPKFWPGIDWLLRKATMERNVTVHIMIDEHELKSFLMRHSLQTLHGYGNISVKTIMFPRMTPDIPFTRLFHSKMCIGEDKAWISTNNLTPNYFENCSGIGCTIFGSTLAGQRLIIELAEVFDRYFNCEYAKYIPLS